MVIDDAQVLLASGPLTEHSGRSGGQQRLVLATMLDNTQPCVNSRRSIQAQEEDDLKQICLMLLLTMAVNFDARSEGLKPEDKFAIADVMSTYALALDTKDYPLLTSLFAVDVEVIMIFDSNSPDGGEIELTWVDAWV